VIQRGWLRAHFGFAYKLEAYTPAAKRKYGYYSLPILWGERFIARMDAKADRKSTSFLVRNLAFEPGFSDYDALWAPLTTKLSALATFAGCQRIVVERTDPPRAKVHLQRAIEVGRPEAVVDGS
jgi:uncharacterized protein YcaQ